MAGSLNRQIENLVVGGSRVARVVLKRLSGTREIDPVALETWTAGDESNTE